MITGRKNNRITQHGIFSFSLNLSAEPHTITAMYTSCFVKRLDFLHYMHRRNLSKVKYSKQPSREKI